MTGDRQQPLLETSGITKMFGGIHALSNISLDVLPRQIVGIIGPNGAGKTTTFNVITGAYRPSMGEVRLDGKAVTTQPPHLIARAGISRTFQNIRLFGDMTVREHLLVAQAHRGFSPRRLLPTRWADPEAFRRTDEILEFLKLGDVKGRIARSLPYGVQRRVEIARAISARPRLLLLDEPVAGMSHNEADDIRGLILKLRAGGLSILLIEHDMSFVMNLCDYLYVLDFGVMIAQGRPEEIRTNPTVLDAYLGHGT
jgi:branched-chain amino acid transport system ATP-binding protein